MPPRKGIRFPSASPLHPLPSLSAFPSPIRAASVPPAEALRAQQFMPGVASSLALLWLLAGPTLPGRRRKRGRGLPALPRPSGLAGCPLRKRGLRLRPCRSVRASPAALLLASRTSRSASGRAQGPSPAKIASLRAGMQVGRISFPPTLTPPHPAARIPEVLLAETPSPLTPCYGWQPGTSGVDLTRRRSFFALVPVAQERSTIHLLGGEGDEAPPLPPQTPLTPTLFSVLHSASVKASAQKPGSQKGPPKKPPESTLTHFPAYGSLTRDTGRPYEFDA